MERENNFSPDIKLTETDAGAVPTISFKSDDAGDLTAERFDIGGNVFDAYYDAAHRLIFVLDYTADKRTPNVLLAIARDPNDASRKWDDILSKDYHVDLETIRPKKNNKYQKLDIEYDGLSVYNGLINAFQNGADWRAALSDLSDFRDMAAGALANARLAAANEQMRTAAETIAETEISINSAHAQIKQTKEKLAKIKTKVGKEPTKESAAKILRAQAKIERTNEKLKRAEVRLRRAHRRLEDAQKDERAARAQLSALGKAPDKKTEPKATDMSEVKPLFTKDPEIMDSSIAFKPIDFASPSAPPASPHFTPPPLNLTPVPNQAAESFQASTPYQPEPAAYAPVTPEMSGAGAPPPQTPPNYDYMANRPAPLSTGPIRSSGSGGRSRPGVMYYIMLLILITLSIMTLWLYQQRMTNNVPNILQPIAEQAEVEPTQTVTAQRMAGGLRASMERALGRPVPVVTEPAYPEPVTEYEHIIQPAPEPSFAKATDDRLADVDDAFLDDHGFMIPVTLPARIPEDMPEDFQWPLPTTEEYHYEENVWAEPDFVEEPEVMEHFDVYEEYHFNVPPNPMPEAHFEEETDEQLVVCEDGSMPYEDGCCGVEVLMDLPGFGPACCPNGILDMESCIVPIR
jgi:hypothetical protein